MGSATDRYARKVVRNGIFNLTEKETGLVLIAPRPTTVELQDGLGDNKPIREVDNQGYVTKVANNHGTREPTVAMTFEGRNIDITALQLNRKTQTVTVNLRYPVRQQILRDTYNPSTVGKLGYSVKEDADTRGSYLNSVTGDTLLLVQQNYVSFNSAIPNSFAIGEHFERKFSNDLVSNASWVVLEPSADYAARSLSEGLLGFLELNGICYLSDNTAEITTADNCFVNPEGAGLTAGDNTTVNLDISGLGKCQPWQIYEIAEEIFCDD